MTGNATTPRGQVARFWVKGYTFIKDLLKNSKGMTKTCGWINRYM